MPTQRRPFTKDWLYYGWQLNGRQQADEKAKEERYEFIRDT